MTGTRFGRSPLAAYSAKGSQHLEALPPNHDIHRRALAELHDEVEFEARRLAAHHAARLHCQRGCTSCCLDDLSVYTVEADRIRQHHPELLEHGPPHPPGACAFLDAEGACRIYAHRPYVCRTQGLPLLWLEEAEDDDVVQRRDICPLNVEGPALEELDQDELWHIGPTEIRLWKIQEDFADGHLERVTLRSLFAE